LPNTVYKNRSVRRHHPVARGGAEARGKIKPRREVSDLEEEDDPIGFSAAISVETTRFVGGGGLGPS
jgi:hypothetical protein